MAEKRKNSNPVFNRNKRYIGRNGVPFGSGVWYDSKGNIIPIGTGHLSSDGKTVKQYNSDGTITAYSREAYARKRMKEKELSTLQMDRKYGIPYIPEKKMTISIPSGVDDKKLRNASFSSNLLDSIALNANKAGLPFKTALGLVAKESTLGYHEERRPSNTPLPWFRTIYNPGTPQGHAEWEKSWQNYQGVQSPTLLVSDWQQYESPFAEYLYNSNLKPLKSTRSESYYDENFNGSLTRDNNNRATVDESPLLHAFKKYKRNPKGYNRNEKGYPNKVAEKGNVLIQHSPEIQQWMNANNVHAEGGELQTWDKLPMRERSAYIEVAVKNGMRNLQDIRDFYNKFVAEGFNDRTNKTYRTNTPLAEEEPLVNDEAANSFSKGGFMPSKSMQKKIASWEGASMYRDTVDPVTGRMMRKNNSFASEARGFVNALPDSIRDTVLANQELADNLYSYSYNVGAGNFKKRVVPALQRYYNGTGSVEDIQNSMWASKDNKLRGLQKRRAAEKEGVEEALAAWDKNMDALNKIIYSKDDEDVDYPDIVKAQPVETMASPVMQEPEPVVEQDPYEGYKNIVAIQNLYKQSEEPASDEMPAFMPKMYDSNAPFVARTYSAGGRLKNEEEKINIFADGGGADSRLKIKNERLNSPESWLVDMTNVGLGAEKKDNYVVDASMNPLEEVVATGKKPLKTVLNKTVEDYLTEGNDAIQIAGLPQNSHLEDKVNRGAEMYAAWDKEHPTAAAARDVATAVPFVVASAPAWIPAGDAMAGNALGQGITRMATNPIVDAAMSSYFGADGLQDVVNGNANWETALEVAPLMYGAYKTAPTIYKSGKNFFNRAIENSRKSLQNSATEYPSPVSYSYNPFDTSNLDGNSLVWELPIEHRMESSKRMRDFIMSPDYERRLAEAGEKGTDIRGTIMDRMLEGDFYPAYSTGIIKDDPAILGISMVDPGGRYPVGITVRNNLSKRTLDTTLDHELAHYTTKNIGPYDELSELQKAGKDGDIQKVMLYDENVVPVRTAKELTKMLNDTQNNLSLGRLLYISDTQEKRARAYSMYEEAKRRGMTTDQLVDEFTENGVISKKAPSDLYDLGIMYTPSNLKKFLNKFLVGTGVVGGASYMNSKNK